jgi:hypothetical protein
MGLCDRKTVSTIVANCSRLEPVNNLNFSLISQGTCACFEGFEGLACERSKSTVCHCTAI